MEKCDICGKGPPLKSFSGSAVWLCDTHAAEVMNLYAPPFVLALAFVKLSKRVEELERKAGG